MNIAEAFYQLRPTNKKERDAIDTIHAAMESLKAANVALEAEVVRLRRELEKAQAACAEMLNYIEGVCPSSEKEFAIQARLKSIDCGTTLLAEVKELREWKRQATQVPSKMEGMP